jgi:hypothetical protein
VLLLMRTRKLHRIIGIALLLPFFGWAITGLLFFIKPGYAGAYEILNPKTYPLNEDISISPAPGWLEFRCFRTVLGSHLIVRTNVGWSHLDPKTLQPKGAPTDEEIKRLLTDAFSANPQRYGNISTISGNSVKTDTGVEITVDWDRLGFQQRGKDTDRIDLLYRVHYLQWTGITGIDRPLGFIGLVLVIALTLLGARLAIKRA